MTAETESERGASTPAVNPRDRRRFAAAVALFVAWIAFIVGLALTDSYRPQERAGTVPDAAKPADG
mgnify:CR=1 FL=1